MATVGLTMTAHAINHEYDYSWRLKDTTLMALQFGDEGAGNPSVTWFHENSYDIGGFGNINACVVLLGYGRDRLYIEQMAFAEAIRVRLGGIPVFKVDQPSNDPVVQAWVDPNPLSKDQSAAQVENPAAAAAASGDKPAEDEDFRKAGLKPVQE